MTPAERDEVLALAARHREYHRYALKYCTDCHNATAVLRYVPAGHVTGMNALITARVVDTVGGLPVIELGPKIGFVAPDSALRIAHALHAAADAAEES